MNVEKHELYRDHYLTSKLIEIKVKDDELDAAKEFIHDRLNENDDNLDDVLDELKINMRLAERSKYVDPSPGNYTKQRPKRTDVSERAKASLERLRKAGRLNTKGPSIKEKR
ncbi:hypothetical protein [Paraliobacillus salinarum]|uniref:hypothetical protein n=1 Tax=Paraliobacillus salinarum TaxID=1158996 RepID=UPI0015F61485|nr:hypothetical protein [Paraliobacillus salinarum]